MLKRFTCLLAAVMLNTNLFAQAPSLLWPSGLMIDLVAHSNYQSVNGYAVQPLAVNLSNPNVQSVLIGSKNPAFSWAVNSTANNARQVAYQLVVADSEKAIYESKPNVWDSGKIISPQSTAVIYNGPELKPNTAYYWTVKVWSSNRAEPSSYAAIMPFYTDTVLGDHKLPAYPIQLTDQQPVSFHQKGNVYYADFGKDAFGQMKLNLYADKDISSVTVRIGEVVNADGAINRKPSGNIRYAQYQLNLRRGLHTYKLQLKPNAINTRPAAVKMPAYIGEVTPFRYVEIEGYEETLKLEDVTRLFAHYQFDDSAANFHSSDTTLNAIWELCKYSMKATSYLGTYVDGDRERIAYEADSYINQLSHYAVDKEYTIARKTSEYLIYHPTWPTEWILQSVLIGWNDYLYTGDIRSLKNNYENLKAKSLTALEDDTHLISILNGKATKAVLASIHFGGEPALRDIVDWPHGAETDGFVFCKYNPVVNAYYYKALTVMQKLAADLGNTADADYYGKKAIAVKKAFHQMFYDAEQQIYVDGDTTKHASLHTNMFALAFELVDAKHRPRVLAFVRSRGMACSVYGSQFLLDAIYNANGGSYGLSLLTSKTDRSWYNMIRVGSTITLEAWDNKYKPNQDWNHAWGAAAGNIISRKLMGIEPLTPGWSTFSVKPQIGGLANAGIDVPTIKGTIKAAYVQTDKMFEMNIVVPGNTTAQIYLPIKGQKYQVWVNDKKVKSHTVEQFAMLNNVGSGEYCIRLEKIGD
ncbi:family 78 glycoside hydrolase catalytic domain [Mucilaginibacter antarcticus]|uniref:alpha-L-rhamnosidase n=1 Tax=Mucilaginibacter antarcticus TaxID=1855725 RepID=A0ABW5XN75_9SPHI